MLYIVVVCVSSNYSRFKSQHKPRDAVQQNPPTATFHVLTPACVKGLPMDHISIKHSLSPQPRNRASKRLVVKHRHVAASAAACLALHLQLCPQPAPGFQNTALIRKGHAALTRHCLLSTSNLFLAFTSSSESVINLG